MSKEASVIVVDVGKFMAESQIEVAQNAIRALIQQKLLFTKRDEIGLVVVGTEESSNPSNAKLPDEYLHVTVARDIELPNLPFLESISTISREDAHGDSMLSIDSSRVQFMNSN
jgi:hypothetical protein